MLNTTDNLLEIEMKFPVTNPIPLRQRLPECVQVRYEADYYFNAPDRDFAQTDEALRLRRIGAANFVTYKGPKCDAQTKTRTEIEVALAEGDQTAEDFTRLLTQLGYRPVLAVRKRRQLYQLEQKGFAVAICLDEVEQLGSFVELEIQAPTSHLEQARAVLLQLAQELGLGVSERRSYLELLLAQQEKSLHESGASHHD